MKIKIPSLLCALAFSLLSITACTENNNMHQELTIQRAITIIGLSAPTSFKQESDPKTSVIGPLVHKYFSENIAAQIPHRKNPGTTYAVYTKYKSDEYGEYRYFFGEEVAASTKAPKGLHAVTVPAGQYLKFTTPAGTMPQVVIKAWQTIWQLKKENKLGAQRTYLADVEVYDQRAADPQHTIVDIYLGVK